MVKKRKSESERVYKTPLEMIEEADGQIQEIKMKLAAISLDEWREGIASEYAADVLASVCRIHDFYDEQQEGKD